MGASSSINNNQQLTEDSEDTAVAVVSFHDNEIQDLIKSFFDFYTNASIATVHSESNTKQNHWNFDRFEIVPIDSVNNIDNIEQKLLTEYFRSISTLHPLRVHQHIFEYISSGILNIPDGDEYAKLMSIVSRIKDQIQSLIAAAELINLVSGNCATISFTSAQEEFLQTAAKRLDSVCRRLDSVGSFAEHLELLRNNSLPIYVQKHIRNESNHFQQPSKIILAYYAIFRGRILPLVLNLKHEILEWAKNYDCEHTKETTISIPPSIPLPTPNAVMGVSLRFLKEFVLSNEIPADMTTAKVVSDIIVPKTRSTKETYINSFLLSTPNSVSDLRKNYRKDKGVLVESGSNYYNKIDGFYCFLSHAWSMPFLELISIAEHAANVYFKSQVKSATFHISDEEDILDSSFFWIDVFCKNQHIPAPAMEEFHKALKAPDVAVIALFPKQPIALQRIWCLFEIWTAVVNNITILPTMSEDSFRYFSATAKANFDSRPDLRVPTFFQDHVGLELRKTVTEQFKSAFLEEMKQMIIVRVEDSTATVPADIDMIMDLINQSTSVGQLNDDIYKAICETLWTRIENECGYSKVRSYKKVDICCCCDTVFPYLLLLLPPFTLCFSS